jgi:hypothetical protein
MTELKMWCHKCSRFSPVGAIGVHYSCGLCGYEPTSMCHLPRCSGAIVATWDHRLGKTVLRCSVCGTAGNEHNWVLAS